MARSADYLSEELRKSQKQLTSAKKRGNTAHITYQRARIAELRKEMEAE
jgi:hypothetical protein